MAACRSSLQPAYLGRKSIAAQTSPYLAIDSVIIGRHSKLRQTVTRGSLNLLRFRLISVVFVALRALVLPASAFGRRGCTPDCGRLHCDRWYSERRALLASLAKLAQRQTTNLRVGRSNRSGRAINVMILLSNLRANFRHLTVLALGVAPGQPARPGGGMKRDDRLRELLPAKDSEYSLDNLSRAETDALEMAFGDGFGNVGAVGYVPMRPPSDVRTGLVSHSFFVSENSDYDHDENPNEFWEWHNDQPPPSESFPLGFVLRRLRIYFENQLDRFCAHVARENPKYISAPRSWLEELAGRKLYEKSWYEYHAVQMLDWLEKPEFALIPLAPVWLTSAFAGSLGRLVEQYYWRFRFEKAAVTGAGARAGASMGGKAKAKLHEAEHSAWQKEAAKIWSRRPNLKKAAVAELIKKQLKTQQTAKHIARFIKPS
jgi:hypothetical protein